MSDHTRPIIGIENRTAQEVFDIMCDRLRTALATAEAERDAARNEALEFLTKTKEGVDASVWHFVGGERMKRVLFAETAIESLNATIRALKKGTPNADK